MKHKNNIKIKKQVVLYFLCFIFCLFTKLWIFALIFVGLAVFNVYLIFCDTGKVKQQNEENGYTKRQYRDYLKKINSEFDIDYEYKDDDI